MLLFKNRLSNSVCSLGTYGENSWHGLLNISLCDYSKVSIHSREFYYPFVKFSVMHKCHDILLLLAIVMICLWYQLVLSILSFPDYRVEAWTGKFVIYQPQLNAPCNQIFCQSILAHNQIVWIVNGNFIKIYSFKASVNLLYHIFFSCFSFLCCYIQNFCIFNNYISEKHSSTVNRIINSLFTCGKYCPSMPNTLNYYDLICL